MKQTTTTYQGAAGRRGTTTRGTTNRQRSQGWGKGAPKVLSEDGETRHVHGPKRRMAIKGTRGGGGSAERQGDGGWEGGRVERGTSGPGAEGRRESTLCSCGTERGNKGRKEGTNMPFFPFLPFFPCFP